MNEIQIVTYLIAIYCSYVIYQVMSHRDDDED